MPKPQLIIGIPSWCEEENIRSVTEMIDAALHKDGFQPDQAILVNADNSSPDRTREEFLAAKTVYEKVSLVSNERGKGHNFLCLFKYLIEVNAEALVTVDADLERIEAGWFKDFYKALTFGGKDMVFPLYFREWFDGNMTNQLVAPLLAAVTGVPIRQPIGGEFGFSPRLCRALVQERWHLWASRFGVDVFCTFFALRKGFSIYQMPMKGGKYHHQRSSSPEEMELEFDAKFNAVVGTLLMESVRTGKISSKNKLEFPKTVIDPTGKDEFNSDYIQISAKMALKKLQERVPRESWWPPLASHLDLSDEKWVQILQQMYLTVRRHGQLSAQQFQDFRWLFYLRMASKLPFLTNENVDASVQEVSRALMERLS